jgi:hypothetical protein
MTKVAHNVLSALIVASIIGLFNATLGFSVGLEKSQLEISFLREQILSMKGDLAEIKKDIKEMLKGNHHGR